MLSVQDVTLRYPSSPRPVMKHLSVTIDQSVTLLGPSGAGKSTLLKALMSFLKPEAGIMMMEGVNLADDPLTARRLASYVPQENDLPRDLSLHEFLNGLARLDGALAIDTPRRVAEVIRKVYLHCAEHRRLKFLSGGMKRRALIASSLLRETPWVLLDEPTLGLDPDESAAMLALIRSLSRSRRVIMATQVVEDAMAVPDRILLLNRGELTSTLRWDELAERAHGHLFIDDQTHQHAGDVLWAPLAGQRGRKVWRTLSREGLRPIEPTPHDGYLWLMADKEGNA